MIVHKTKISRELRGDKVSQRMKLYLKLSPYLVRKAQEIWIT